MFAFGNLAIVVALHMRFPKLILITAAGLPLYVFWEDLDLITAVAAVSHILAP